MKQKRTPVRTLQRCRQAAHTAKRRAGAAEPGAFHKQSSTDCAMKQKRTPVRTLQRCRQAAHTAKRRAGDCQALCGPFRTEYPAKGLLPAPPSAECETRTERFRKSRKEFPDFRSSPRGAEEERSAAAALCPEHTRNEQHHNIPLGNSRAEIFRHDCFRRIPALICRISALPSPPDSPVSHAQCRALPPELRR